MDSNVGSLSSNETYSIMIAQHKISSSSSPWSLPPIIPANPLFAQSLESVASESNSNQRTKVLLLPNLLAKRRVVACHFPEMSAQPPASTPAVPPTVPSVPLTRAEEVNTSSPPNLIGALGTFTRLGIPTNGRFMHPLAPDPPTPSSIPPVAIGQIPNGAESTLELVKRFVSLLPKISYSLNAASSYPINDARVLSLYKEGSQQEHISLKVRINDAFLSL